MFLSNWKREYSVVAILTTLSAVGPCRRAQIRSPSLCCRRGWGRASSIMRALFSSVPGQPVRSSTFIGRETVYTFVGKKLTFRGTKWKHFAERRVGINSYNVLGDFCCFIGRQYVFQFQQTNNTASWVLQKLEWLDALKYKIYGTFMNVLTFITPLRPSETFS
jgi:hypothetical protein